MVTEFGKMLRKERIDRSWTLNDMALLLEISPAYLSHMEMGRRPVPQEVLKNLCQILEYRELKAKRLRQAAELAYSPDIIKIHSQNLKQEDRDLVKMFARRFQSLDEHARKKMFKILDDKEGDNDE